MDTAQQALFKAMLTDGWFTQSTGNVESPTGYFGWTVNTPAELSEIRREFSDTLEAYGPVPDEQLIGAWFATINDQGIIRIDKVGDIPAGISSVGSLSCPAATEARKRFDETETEWIAWEDN